jgi:hypothetical protein
LYAQRNAVGGLASEYYWSSTENDKNTNNNMSAWLVSFYNGTHNGDAHKSFTAYVRAIRAF